MFKLNDRVLEKDTGVKGVVIDLDDTIDKTYGVLFEDVDEDKGVWWCDGKMIINMKDIERIGKELYKQFREGNFIGNYLVSRKFIDDLSDSEIQELMNGFIEERKKHCDPKDTEEEQVETFWAMYNETV